MDGTNHNTYNEKRLEVFLELKNHPIPFVVATGIG